jgi:predicted peptidase
MKMRFLVLLALLTGALFSCKKGVRGNDNRPAVFDSTPSPFMQRTVVKLDATHEQNAWLQLPIHYNSGFDTEKYPLLIFFNGKFESALFGGLEKLIPVGVPKYMADSIRFSFDTGSKKQQFIVLCPQSENGFPSPISINLIIDYMVAKYRVDASRIYLTGVSSGAASIFSYLTNKQEYANRIAAAVPMSSTALESEKVANLSFIANAGIPTQIFCGTADNVFNQNKSYADAINRSRPGLAVFNAYNSGHGNWNPFYDPKANPSIYEWMLQHRN